MLLRIFDEGFDVIREQTVRILLERVIVTRPHPWGILYTLAELLGQHDQQLPSAPAEIERILQHVRDVLVS